MRFHQFLTAVAVSTGLASCASAPPVSSAPGPATDQNVTAYPTMKLWTGTLNPTRSYNASAVASQRQNAYGRVEVTVSPNSPMLSHVMLKVSVPNEPGLDVAGWGLSEGRCGSGNPPVLSRGAFPAIQISTNGQGNVDANIPFIIPDNGAYHVDVFRGSGTQLSDVLTCGDLRRES